MIRDLTDDEARAASPLKWGMTEPGVIPAWVAEMDYAVAEVTNRPQWDLPVTPDGDAYALDLDHLDRPTRSMHLWCCPAPSTSPI